MSNFLYFQFVEVDELLLLWKDPPLLISVLIDQSLHLSDDLSNCHHVIIIIVGHLFCLLLVITVAVIRHILCRHHMYGLPI